MTILCPYCDHLNIEGVDVCDECGQSLNDLHLPMPATAVERALLKDRVGVLKPRRPIMVAPGTPVQEVLQLLIEHSIGCVLVVEDARIIGIFSERDALRRLNTEVAELGDCPVSQFMTPNPQTLVVTAKIAFAIQRMDLGGYRHVPIVDQDGYPVGIISVRDILHYLSQKMLATGTPARSA